MKSGTLREWSTQDKSGWGPGPWQDEPDKRQWVDANTGLPCLMVRNRFGNWCGYVGLSDGHPLFGESYGFGAVDDLEVHGGITFGGPCQPHEAGEEGKGVCHIPEPGMTDKVHWLGFDCGHCWDVAPALQARLREIQAKSDELRSEISDDEVYRDTAYVQAEVEKLAKQLVSKKD